MTLKAFVWGALFFLMPLAVSAQETPSPVPALVIANINISDTRILSQAPDGILRVISTITNNGTETQSDIRTGLDIIKKTDKNQTLVDSFISEQTLSLAPGESLQQELQYPAQSFLDGEYEVWVISRTTGGVMLGLNMAGKTTFVSTGATVEIIPETCMLQVTGDEKSYTLRQGVDVATAETLLFSCALENHSTNTVTVAPTFVTYRRTTYGEPVTIAAEAPAVVTLTANEKKEVSFVIPKATDPQAYDVSIALVDQSAQVPVSNKVIAHYVLRGASATIQSLTFQHQAYIKGSPLSATLFWTPSADRFPDSRAGSGTALSAIIVKMTVSDGNGTACIEPLEKQITATDTNPLTLETAIITECAFPQVTVSLVDEAGKTLDARTFASAISQEQEVPDSLSASIIPNSLFVDLKFLIISIIVLLFLISLLLIGRKFVTSKRKFPTSGTLRSFLFLSLFSSGVFVGAGQASALTLTMNPAGDVGAEMYTVNTDKSTYFPGETIALYGTISWGGPSYEVFGASLSMKLNGTSVGINGSASGGSSIYGVTYLTAPTSLGTYNIIVRGCNIYDTCTVGSITISVAAASVAGACNMSAPNSCAAGSLGINALQSDGSYQWYCNGSNGGATSNLCWYVPPVVPQSSTPINGACNMSLPNACAKGVIGANALQPNGDYHWYCNGLNGGSVSPLCWYTPSVTAQPPVALPTAPPAPNYYNGQNVDIIAVPNPVPYNTAALLKWKTVYMTDCTASGAWSGAKTVHGGYSYYPGESTGNLTSAKTYKLSCVGSNGAVSGTASVTVNVLPPAAAPAPVPSCVMNCSAADNYCSGQPFTDANNCGTNNCIGTRFCDLNWREVAP